MSAVALLPFLPLALAVALLPLGTAFTFPCVTALLSRVIPSNERGLYMGVQQTFGGAARVVFPILAGFAFDRFQDLPFLVSAGARSRHDFPRAWVWKNSLARSTNLSRQRRLSRHTLATRELSGRLGSMFGARLRIVLSLAAAVSVAACGSDSTGTGGSNSPANLSVISGNGQVGLVGTLLSQPLVVKVTNSSGTTISGIAVTFTVVSGAATVTPSTATTDATGQAKANVTLGSTAGTVSISASVVGTNLTASFVVTAGTSTQTIACSTVAPQTPAAGGVLPGVTGTGICLGAGASGADYAVVAFYGDSNQATLGQVTVTSHNATALSTPDIAPLANVFATRQPAPGLSFTTSNAQEQFDLRLRHVAQTQLAPMVPGARAAMRSGARRSVIPSSLTVGQIITLNANGNSGAGACTTPINVGARVAAISNGAYVLADTANPAGGFSDADYASFGATFDTLVSPVDVNAFGAPTDIDHNGKIVILFTKEVNKLTARGSNGVVGGFFYERDLFPTVSNPSFEGCPTSNVGEIYYSLVPDPNAVFSDKRSASDVLSLTPGTLAHEFQHLINAGRRLYVNTTADFPEVVWLNEGLSHIAEELLFYKAADLAPRQNIDLQRRAHRRARSSPATRATTSVGSTNSCPSRRRPRPTPTTTTSRRAARRGICCAISPTIEGASDGTTWSQLVNANEVGQANLANVFGSNYLTQIRDWATAVFADDVPGVTDARFLEPSWNMRSIFPGLSNGNGARSNRYPLSVVPLVRRDTGVAVDHRGRRRRTSASASPPAVRRRSTGRRRDCRSSPFVQFTVVRTR